MKNKRLSFYIILSVLKCAPIATVISIICSLGFALCTAWGAGVLAELLTEVEILSKGNGSDHIIWPAAIYIGIMGFRKLLNVVSDISANVGVEEKCRYYFRMELHKKAASIPYIDFENDQVYDQLQRAKECIENSIITETFHNILSVIESFFAVAGVLLVMVDYSIWYLPISLLSIVPYLIGRIQMGKEFYKLRWFQASHIRKKSYFYSIFSSPRPQKELRIFGFRPYIQDKWEKERDMVAEETISFRRKDSRRLMYCEGIITAGYLLSILLSVFLVFRGQIAVGVFGAGIFAFQDVQSNMKAFFSLLGYAFNELMEADNYYGFLRLGEEGEGNQTISDFTKQIEVKKVSFTYPNAKKPAVIIDELFIKAGEKIVIVGENGSGKTTLSKLLLGLYSPQSGEILYDGKPVSQLCKKDLAKMISAVSQSFVTYHLPIRDNIAIHCVDESIGDGELEAVLQKVGLKDFSDPEEYDKWLGREFGGKELSGGQWQRLAIAGAMAKPHQILFLDEPTSALDPTSEYDILRMFWEMSEEKTAIVISHRVGLCSLADKVVFMKEGRVMAVGSHQELIKTCDEYTVFYNEQAKWYVKR